MNRRQFIFTGAGALAWTGAVHGRQSTPSAQDAAAPRSVVRDLRESPLRVGLIGCGWYGKTDLLRLIQVHPVDVVSLCDADQRMLAEAVELVSLRQASKKKPRGYSDYRRMLEIGRASCRERV